MRHILAFGSAVLLASSLASAGAVLTTGIADWKFKSFSPLTGSAGVASSPNTSAVAIVGNSAWAAPSAVDVASTPGVPSWISATANGATNGFFGLYEYELTLTGLAPGLYEISGKFTSDNLVDSFKINGSEKLTGFVGPTEQSYKFVYSVPANATGSANPDLTITVRIYNESTTGPNFISNASWNTGNLAYPVGPNAANSTTNPTGFILDGSAVIIPLPAAAWAGLALLGVGGVIHRRVVSA